MLVRGTGNHQSFRTIALFEGAGIRHLCCALTIEDDNQLMSRLIGGTKQSCFITTGSSRVNKRCPAVCEASADSSSRWYYSDPHNSCVVTDDNTTHDAPGRPIDSLQAISPGRWSVGRAILQNTCSPDSCHGRVVASVWQMRGWSLTLLKIFNEEGPHAMITTKPLTLVNVVVRTWSRTVDHRPADRQPWERESSRTTAESDDNTLTGRWSPDWDVVPFSHAVSSHAAPDLANGPGPKGPCASNENDASGLFSLARVILPAAWACSLERSPSCWFRICSKLKCLVGTAASSQGAATVLLYHHHY
jgi:hypothetical protein